MCPHLISCWTISLWVLPSIPYFTSDMGNPIPNKTLPLVISLGFPVKPSTWTQWFELRWLTSNALSHVSMCQLLIHYRGLSIGVLPLHSCSQLWCSMPTPSCFLPCVVFRFVVELISSDNSSSSLLEASLVQLYGNPYGGIQFGRYKIKYWSRLEVVPLLLPSNSIQLQCK